MKRYSIFLFLLTFIHFNVQAQKTYSEFGQVKKKDHAKEFIWEEATSLGKYPDVPPSYKNASYVYLLKDIHQSIDCYKSLPTNGFFDVRVRYIIRNVVKLQDKAALEDYSELYFDDIYSDDDVNLRIIKPSGEVKEYGVTDFNETSRGSYKYAVPNLEVGDIIDYYSFETLISDYQYESFRVHKRGYIRFVDDAPTMEQNLTFYLKRNTYFINSSLNGAPKAIIEDITDNEYENTRRKIRFSSTLIDAQDIDAKWTYPFREFPVLRYQFATGKGTNNQLKEYFFDKEDKASSERSTEDIKAFIEDNIIDEGKPSCYYCKSYLKRTKKYVKTLLTESISKEEKAKKLFYYMQYEFGNTNYRSYAKNEVYSYYLKQLDIPHNYLVYTSRRVCHVEDILSRYDVNTAIQVKLNNENHYLRWDRKMEQIPNWMQGVEGYTIRLHPNYDSDYNYQKITVPVAASNSNIEHTSIDAQIDNKDLKIDVTTSASGERRMDFYDDYNVYRIRNAELYKYNEQEEDEDYEKYLTPFEASVDPDTDLEYDEDGDYDFEMKKNLIRGINSEVLHAFGSELDSIYDMTVVQTGSTPDDDFIHLKYTTVLHDYVKKVGPNYLIDAGRLIGSQVDISDENRTRDINVNMNFAREFNNDINIEIPEGYSVDGLDKFNMNVENETGSFVSSAKVEGNKLLIHTEKKYASIYEPKENWSKMLEFLDAAFDFTHQKILFKK